MKAKLKKKQSQDTACKIQASVQKLYLEATTAFQPGQPDLAEDATGAEGGSLEGSSRERLLMERRDRKREKKDQKRLLRKLQEVSDLLKVISASQAGRPVRDPHAPPLIRPAVLVDPQAPTPSSSSRPPSLANLCLDSKSTPTAGEEAAITSEQLAQTLNRVL